MSSCIVDTVVLPLRVKLSARKTCKLVPGSKMSLQFIYLFICLFMIHWTALSVSQTPSHRAVT